jgi:prepilin-type N-terminal cleavage/methylation domain-containing protein
MSGTASNRLRAEGGMTLVELLVVLVIMVVVLAALVDLFVSAIHSQTDQTNRVSAQQDARLALERLRREIHCASAVTASSTTLVTVSIPPSCFGTTLGSAITTLPQATITVANANGFPSGTNTFSIGSSGTITCTGKTSTTFTGCTGGTGGPYAVGAAVVGTAAKTVTWCTAGSGPYSLSRYEGALCSGTGVTLLNTLASGAIFPSVTSAATSTTLVNSITLPATPIAVVSVAGFPAGTNVVSIGSTSGSITCTGVDTVAKKLTTCTGGTGKYSAGARVSVVGQQLAVVAVSLQLQSESKPTRLFTLNDSIELRNSRT